MTSPVRRFNDDLKKLHAAQQTRAHDAKNLHTAEHALGSDTRQLAREKDTFTQDGKKLTAAQAKLSQARDTEQAELGVLDQLKAAVQAKYDASVDPTTGQGDPALKSELDTITQFESDLKTKLDAQVSTDAQDVGDLRAALQKGRLDINHLRAGIQADHQHVKSDTRALDKARTHEHDARQRALKDLQPAEYKMNLKQTNEARAALGLKKVKHVIRPDAGGQKTVDLARKYLGKYESQLQAMGVTQAGVPTSESCANFVTSMLQKSGAINFHTNLVSDLSAQLKARGWHVVPLSQAKPGDVWIALNPSGAPSEQHTELVASNSHGKVTLIGSNNFPVSSNQQINYDTYSANITGSYILAPPGK